MNSVVIDGKVASLPQAGRDKEGAVTHVFFQLRRARRQGDNWTTEYYDVVCFPPLCDYVLDRVALDEKILVLGRLSQIVKKMGERTVRYWRIIAEEIYGAASSGS